MRNGITTGAENGMYAIVGAMVSSEQEAQQASQPLMLIVLSPLFLLQAVLFNPATQVAKVTSMIPFAAPVLMPLRLSLVPVPNSEIALSLALNAIACIAVMWVAARVYRVGILMYGKRASIREVARWQFTLLAIRRAAVEPSIKAQQVQ